MGKFIAIDGLDGSGKGTQSEILVERLKKEGIKIPIYCPNCNVPISETIYNMKRPWDYICPMCNHEVFPELKKRIELNEAYNLMKELSKE